MKIPKEIRAFVRKKMKLKNYCLPQHYPRVGLLGNFEKFQVGYKVDGLTGKKLTGEKEGDFRESWLVICSGYANDPFFIDMEEETQNFPVYFAFHGAGSWKPMKVAESITVFAQQLQQLKKLEQKKKNIQAEVEKSFDLTNPFWLEVHKEYQEDEG